MGGDGLPVEPAPKKLKRPQPFYFHKGVGFNLVFVGRHHFRHGRRSGFQRYEQEPPPVLKRDRKEPVILGPEAGIFGSMRRGAQPPVASVAPRMIRAGQNLGATTGSVDQPRPAVATDVGKSPRRAIVATDDEDAFAEIFEAAPFARLTNLAFMAHDLRRAPQERRLFCLEEFGIVIEPAGQAHRVERVSPRLNGFEVRGHRPHLPFQRLCGNGRSAWGELLLALRYLRRQPEGRATGARQRSAKNERIACRFTSMFSSRARTWLKPRSMRSRKMPPKLSRTMAGKPSTPEPRACQRPPTGTPRTAKPITSNSILMRPQPPLPSSSP